MTNTLNGLRVLNTRPQEQGRILSEQIHQAGGLSIALPTLEIKENNSEWLELLPDLKEVSSALFISANAVHYCFKLLQEHHISWPKHIHVIAIGQNTANTLKHYRIKVDDLPLVPNSEHVLTLPSLQQIKQKIILLFKGEGGRTLIEESLITKQAKLIILAVYQRILPAINYQFTNSLWRDDAVDIILLTSEQSIHNLFKLFSQDAHHWLQNKPCLVISERLAKTASILGIKKIKISHPNWIINTLLDYKDHIHGE